MNYDTDAPFAVTRYRHMQKAFPGADALYGLARASLEAALSSQARILIVGVGGGREIESFTAIPHPLQFVGVDPSADMLSIADRYTQHAKAEDRVTLVQGTVTDLPGDTTPFDAATSLLVMHFLPDDDTDAGKRAVLSAIRARLSPGSLFLLADISVDHPSAFDRFEPVFLQHARNQGLSDDEMKAGPEMIRKLPVVSEPRTRELLSETGFAPPQRIFQTLWYKGWITTAL